MTAQYSPAVAELLKQVQSHFPGPVKVRIADDKSGVLTHDQAQTIQGADQSLDILISDATDVDYTLSHELVHILMTLKGFPQMFFDTTTKNQDLDDQIIATATSLYNSVAHAIIKAEQAHHGIINDTVGEKMAAGFAKQVKTDEADPDKKELIYQLLTLLDQLVFFEGGTEEQQANWDRDYHRVYAFAMKLYLIIAERPITSPFEFRRTVINVFKTFDDIIDGLGYQPLPYNEFVTLQSVLSERQLRLQVKQLFVINHSTELEANSTGERAYIGMGKSDNQNAFVLSKREKLLDSDNFKQLYEMTVKDLFTLLQLPYTMR